MARSEPNIFSQKWGKGWAGAVALITMTSGFGSTWGCVAAGAIRAEIKTEKHRQTRRVKDLHLRFMVCDISCAAVSCPSTTAKNVRRTHAPMFHRSREYLRR